MVRARAARMQRWMKSAGTAVDAQPVRAGVAGRDEQLARVALEAVAREVQQQQVVRATVREEVVDVRLHLVRGGVVHDRHLEAADLRVSEDGLRGPARRPRERAAG